jgi:plastocyanin
MRRLPAIVALAILILAAAVKAETRTVSIKDLSFSPARITVKVGDTVVWQNEDDRDHTVAADDGSFKSANIRPKGTFSQVFAQRGTFGYSCTYHPRMKGAIVVE